MELTTIQQICVYALPVLFAITLHEAAHAFAAKRFGDPTAFLLGRMTLNPIKHIDPLGTVILPLACVLTQSGFLFGWAKPVPVNFEDLHNPKRDMLWVAAAGPFANLLMIIGWALILKASVALDGSMYQVPLALMGQAGIQINMVIMLINLVPIPPLDGGRILVSLLPNNAARQVSRLEPYGMWIMIALLMSRVLGYVLQPIMAMMYGLLARTIL